MFYGIRAGQALCMVFLLAATWLAGCSGGTTEVTIAYSGDPVNDFVLAIQERDVKKAKALLEADSSLMELRDDQGQTPLHYAAIHNASDIVELLIDKGMDPNIKDNEGRTPLKALEDAGLRLDAAREALTDNGGTL